MTSLTKHLVLLIALLVHSSSWGADLVLREHVTQHGSLIRLGDIADIGASSAAELSGLASTPLLPAPAKGTRQFLTAAQVRDLLAARGVQLEAVTFKGSSIVQIGSADLPVKLETRSATPRLTHQQVEQRVQTVIASYLQTRETAGHWHVEVSLSERQSSSVLKLGANLVARGQQQLRSGKQRFLLSGAAEEQELAVLATITQRQPVVIIVQRVERDQVVRAADVEIREREGNLPSGSLTELQQVVGKAAQRTLLPEAIVLANQLRAAWQVHRGETVNVFVRTGGIVVRTRAIAKENGAMGQLIAVETVEDKQRLMVSVSGAGEVTVYATGGQSTDYASLTRKNRQDKPQRR